MAKQAYSRHFMVCDAQCAIVCNGDSVVGADDDKTISILIENRLFKLHI